MTTTTITRTMADWFKLACPNIEQSNHFFLSGGATTARDSFNGKVYTFDDGSEVYCSRDGYVGVLASYDEMEVL